MSYTGKQRMLNAYRGKFSDRIPIAPELWYYYPAKVLGVNMIEFERNVSFHMALKTVFEKFNCEGWGIVFGEHESEDVEQKTSEKWLNDKELLSKCDIITPKGKLTSSTVFSTDEPSWVVERPIKDIKRDLPAYEQLTIAGNPEKINFQKINK